MSEILYGRVVVLEALRAHRRKIKSVLLAEDLKTSDAKGEILTRCHRASIPVRHVGRAHLDAASMQSNHQGVAADVGPYPYASFDDLLGALGQQDVMPLLLLLDCIQDPQNLGVLFRTAEAVGVHAVVIPRHRSASVTAAVSKVSAGAVEHLRVAQVTNLVRAMDRLKRIGIWVIGIERSAEAEDYRRVDLNAPVALAVGSEGRGLRRLVRKNCDLLMQIPMRGRVQSLNAAVAGSIALYRAWESRQRDEASRPG